MVKKEFTAHEVEAIKDRSQLEAVKDYLRVKSIRDYCLFVLGINSGLRISDLLQLRVGDVIENGTVRSIIKLKEQKTSKNKAFDLNNSAKQAILDYLKTRKECGMEEPLFCGRKGDKAIQRQHAWRILSEACEAVGITGNIGTHTLRKTFGYHLYNKTNDITLVQKILNHSSPSITLSYIGITSDIISNAYLDLNL
jgi:integrase